jgi:ParB-like chromosome segregation protein Spo0J
MAQRPAAPTPAANIAEPLRPLAVPVDNLTPDPDNDRRGDVTAIRRSLNTFGQRKPIVVKRTGADAHGRPAGIVIAGNHTLLAAVDLGWTEVAAVFTDDDALTARAYALTDNRTGELATWDEESLAAHLRELQVADFDMTALGWDDDDLAKILGAGPAAAPGEFPAYDDETIETEHRCPKCGFEWSGGS